MSELELQGWIDLFCYVGGTLGLILYLAYLIVTGKG